MVDDELLTKIVAEHGLWAYRLLRTVETGISAVPPDAVAADDRCVLGMWLNGDARTVLDADIRADIVNRHRDLHRVAARLLTLALEGQRDEAVAALAPGGELSRAATGLVATIESWRPDDDTASAADRLTTDAVREELLGNVGMVRAHAEIATSAIREVAGDVGALADGVGEGLSSISEMADRAETTSREVVESRERTGASQKLLGGLQESVGRIGHVLALIDKIAKDTHLLALNANVEAARAGEAGRGFGVVANEVKQLAHDVARATREIKGIIEAVQRDATAILGEIDQFVGSIGRVADNQTLIVRAIEHQRSITQRMADRLTTTAASIGVVEESASSAAFGARGAAVVAVSLVDRLSSAASGERPVRRYQLRGGGEWFLTPDAAHLLNCVGNGEHVVFYAVADGAAVGELRPDYGTAPCGGGIFCNPAGRLTLISWDPTGQFHVRDVGSGALQVSLQEAGPPVTVAVNEEHWRLICETGRTAQVGRSRQEVATVWDLNTGLVIEEVSGDNLPRYHSGYSAHSAADALVAEAVSPDGGLCVATVQEAAGAALVLYKAGSGDEVFRAAEASAEKARAAFSADGALLLTHWQAGNDGWVDVWELPGAVRGTGERPSDARRRRSPS